MYLSRIWQFDPWRELDRIHDEMNRLFADALGRTVTSTYPPINIYVKDDNTVVTAELPGFDVKDLDITVLNDELRIKGTRKKPELGENVQIHRQESGVDSFQRNIQLPYAVESDKVEAKFDRGVLVITLPRAEADKPRKIKVSTK